MMTKTIMYLVLTSAIWGLQLKGLWKLKMFDKISAINLNISMER